MEDFVDGLTDELKNYSEWLLQQGYEIPVDIDELVDEYICRDVSTENIYDYEYEMLIEDEGTPFEVNSWVPIATERIKDLSKIDEYIKKGLIRKRQQD